MSSCRRPSSQPWVAASLVVLMVWEVSCGTPLTSRSRRYESSAGGDSTRLRADPGAGQHEASPPRTQPPRTPQDVFSDYFSWQQAREAELKAPTLAESERRVGELALLCFGQHIYAPDQRPLRTTTPARLWETCRLDARRQVRLEAERAVALEAKLEEYWQWARRVAATTPPKFRRAGKDWLLTEAPEVEQSREVLVRAVMQWAFSHTSDPAFYERSPSEVALYLMARDSALATVVRLGKLASPRVDYTPVGEEPPDFPEVATELLVGFIPAIGQVVLLLESVVGINLSGSALSKQERILLAFAVLLPLAVLARRGASLERAALLTGRSAQELEVLSRVARRLSPEDMAEVEAALREVALGKRLSEKQLASLNRMAQGMEGALARFGELVRQGGRGPGWRAGPGGMPFKPGSAEHLADCWVEYQFRHPQRYPRFSYTVDPWWERLYRSILANKAAGGAFEEGVLAAQGYPKNVALMMPPPGSGLRGFIPDSVRGNPAELVWGLPYHFVEVKGRQELAKTGNLKAMLEYVDKFGGHLEIWVRSAKHPSGATEFTRPLQELIQKLTTKGMVEVRYHP